MFQDQVLPIIIIYTFQDQCSNSLLFKLFRTKEITYLIFIVYKFMIFVLNINIIYRKGITQDVI